MKEISQLFIPGLKREELCIVRKTRRLPIPGEVLVKEGENVNHDQIIARAEIIGPEMIVDVYDELHILSPMLDNYTFNEDLLIKGVGDKVAKEEIIARRKTWGLITKTCLAPINGVIEKIDLLDGRHPTSCLVHIRLPSQTTKLNAFIPGRVNEILENEGAVIETPATYIQGIFGIGPETQGELTILSSPSKKTKNKLTEDYTGKIIVVENYVDDAFLKKATKLGVRALILGSISDNTLENFLGSKPDVVTGGEEISPTLIVTEGFGYIKILEKTFDLLKKNEGKMAFVNGATQMRAGVIRPEIIIPHPKKYLYRDRLEQSNDTWVSEGIKAGDKIRITRGPLFGRIGYVRSLPVTPITLESEIKTLIVEMETEDGEIIIVPRSNTEII